MKDHRIRIVSAIVLGLTMASPAITADLSTVIGASADNVQLAQASQKRIDDVVLQTEDLEIEYKQVMKRLDGLEVYNEYMERQIAHQEQELAELRRSIDDVSSVERQIMPLMIRMLDGLEQFIELDVPFLKDERMNRVAGLRSLMERADISVAEKFRRLTEAFQIENDFGRTIETYKDTLTLDDATLEVNVLRLGRVGLFYQTNDTSQTGLWDQAARQWVSLGSGAARNQIRQGIRIARKQVAPDLLLLEIPAPEVAP
jgi:hypothetical protein